MKIKSKFVLRLFVSMIAVLLLPVCVLYVIYSQFIATSVANEVNEMIKNEQATAMRLLDNSLLNYREKALFLQQSDGFQSYLFYQSFTTDNNGDIASEVILKDISYTYRLSQNIDAMLIYFPEAETVISAGFNASIARSSKFFSHNYINPSIPDIEGYLANQESFAALNSGALLSRNPDTVYISLIYPIHLNTSAYIVVCVPEESFSGYFDVHSDNMGLTTLVYNQSGELMFSKGDDAELVAHYSLRQNKIPDDGLNHNVEWNGREYLTMQTISTQSGWQAVTFVPLDSYIYSTLFDVGSFFVVFILLTCVVGSLLIYFLVRVNYRPVQKLRQTAIGSAGKTTQSTSDEFTMIADTLAHLQNENSKLSETVSANIEAIYQTRLTQLLNDSYSSLEEFNTDCEQIGLSFNYPLFYVSSFLIPPEHRSALEVIAKRVNEELCKAIESKYVFSVKRDQLVFIHNVPCVQDASNFEPFYAALGTLNDLFSITSVVGIGHVHAGTENINKSLLQAINALEYRFVKGTGTVISYNEVTSNFNASYPYPKQEIRKLQNLVSAGDSMQIKHTIDDLMRYIIDKEIPAFLSRSICADILKALLTESHNSIIDAYQLSEMLMHLSKAETINELIGIIENVRKKLNDKRSGDTLSANTNQLLNEVLSYIGENYYRCDFSIQEVASRFSMLPSNLSSFFKDNMHCTMLDYLIELRMNLAKELLRSTSLPLQEICTRVGYYNVSSFSRRFKTYEGITPNTYRFQNQ